MYHTFTYSNKKQFSLSKTVFLLVCLLACQCTTLYAQVPVNFEQSVIKDSIPKPRIRWRDRPLRPTRARIELGAAVITPWIYDKLAGKDYANITWETTKRNVKPSSWEWDDFFQTNQFGHPFHGAQFYNTFRDNGYTFWQAAPATMVGSYLWETFAENMRPSINDFVNTTFGGIVLGEMTYRFSNKIVNSERTGFRRQASEVLSLIINPTHGINRILDGKWGRVSKRSKVDSSDIIIEIDAGIRTFNRNSSNILHNNNYGAFGRVKLLYGTPYNDYHTPFSNITANLELGKDDSTLVNVIAVYGSLAGWEIKSTEKLQHLAILSANYDLLHNSSFFYGGQSVKMNILSEFNITEKTKINTNLSGGPILLAAMPDPYLLLKHGRNYDYGVGAGFGVSGLLTIENKFTYGVSYRGGWTHTINGHPSHHFLHTVSSEASVILSKKFALAAESGYFHLHSNYHEFATVDSNYPYLRISTRYTFKL